MTSSTNEMLEELKLKLEPSDHESAKFFQENGYCIIPPSQLVLDNIDEFRKIIDMLMIKESWRGGWEGKEQYMKYKKTFNKGANRLANLFNKDKLFLKILSEKALLKTLYGLFGNDMKIGALDMREPLPGTGWQELHIDWLPKKNSDDPIQNVVCSIFLDRYVLG